MKYVIDIDGTICDKQENHDYDKSFPYHKRITKINQLYDEGNQIVYYTARGMGRNENNAALAIEQFYSLTEEQLKEWGAKYTQLMLGKPSADVYVDDKGISDGNFFRD